MKCLVKFILNNKLEKSPLKIGVLGREMVTSITKFVSKL